jgi:carbon-monoxide dehydrogenase large subunit
MQILIGTKSSGQSHETAYAQIAAATLGVSPERFEVVQGDTALIARGNGTGASRSMTTGGSAVLRAGELLLVEARQHAARLLQCSPGSLEAAGGVFTVPGPGGAQIDLAGIARTLPGARLHVTASFRPADVSFPHGCHVADVEVDPETGEVELVAYRAVQDAGVAINPMVAEAQLMGGVAQGVGAALMERLVMDAQTAQPLAASFVDYAMPRAIDLSFIDVQLRGFPCASNPLGAKAIGEAGTVAAPPAVINAIVNALAPLGVTHIDLPATPQRVWSAVREAQEITRKDEAHVGRKAS